MSRRQPNDSIDDGLIALRDVPSLLPRRRGKKVHYSTVFRWATRGARGAVLPTRLVGGVRYTTLKELRGFLEATAQSAIDSERNEAIKRALYGGADTAS